MDYTQRTRHGPCQIALEIDGLSCTQTARAVEQALANLSGVTLVHIDTMAEMAYIACDACSCDWAHITAIVELFGFQPGKCVLRRGGCAVGYPQDDSIGGPIAN